jgi:hypothetical protein
MGLASDLNAFCDWLRAEVDKPVILGRPDDAISGLYVWPWRIMPRSGVSNAPPRPPDRPPVPSATDVYFLLVPSPALAGEGLASLEAARRAIDAHPVSGSASGFRVLAHTDLTVADLTKVFIAGRMELTICLAFILQGRSSDED